LTDLERAGRLLVAREPIPVTPVDQIRARAAEVARRRTQRRRRSVAIATVVVVLIGLSTWALARSVPSREPVATTPAPSTSVTIPSSTVPQTTDAPATTGPIVGAARITSATLGMAATYGRNGSNLLWLYLAGTWHNVTPASGISGGVEDVFALDPLHLWAVSYDPMAQEDVWRSVDGGQTWSHTVAGGHSGYGKSQVQFVDTLHGWVMNESLNGPLAVLFATSDGGATWTRVDGRLPAEGIVSFYTASDGYLGSDPNVAYDAGLYVTHDAGRTWQEVKLPLDATSWPNPSWAVVYGVPTFVDDHDGVLPVTLAQANTADVEWWTTRDGGESWQLRTPPSASGVEAHPLEVTAQLTSVTGPHVWWTLGYHRGDTSVSVTLDAGAHWTDTDDTALSWPSPSWFGAANADVAWMRSAHLFGTTDGGHTWKVIDPPG
jgi:photosystem II stability/assembly factor-like uncharacterized protein